MRDGGYRDPLAALRRRIADKRRTVPAPEDYLTLLRRALLPPALAAEIEALGPPTLGRGDTIEELARIDRALDTLASRYDSARVELERLAVRPARLGLPHLAERVGRAVGVEARERLDAVAEARGTTVDPWEPWGLALRFASHGVPMLLAVTSLDEGMLLAHLRVAVPTGLSQLTVRPQTFGDTMLDAVGLASEVELRVRSFDEEFWIEGDERTARVILGPDARASMRALRSCEPLLRVMAGVAEIVWRWPWRRSRDLDAAQDLANAIATTTS